MSWQHGTRSERSNLFGGRGTVTIHDLLEGSVAAPFTAVLACELEPRGAVGPHRQEHMAEIVVILSGVGEGHVDKEPRALVPGVVLHLPLGSVLAMRNTGSEPLGYLIVKAPPPTR